MARMVPYSLSPYGTGDIKNGSPTITIINSLATLSVAQTGNIGVGCCIEFDSPTVYVYIAPNRIQFNSGGTTELKIGDEIEGNTSGATGIVRAIEVNSGSWAGGDAAGYIYFSKTTGTWQNAENINRTKPTTSNNIATTASTLRGNLGNGNTQFVVKTATGFDAGAVSPAETVASIHHEYASLSAYEAGFTDANHINDTDLTNADVIAYACCYYDHDNYTLDTTGVDINFGTTGINNYLYVFTPTGDDESINKQRHNGSRNVNRYFLRNTTYAHTLKNSEQYVRINGLQIENASANSYLFGLPLTGGGTVVYDIEIRNCIIIDGAQATNKDGILFDVADTGSILKVVNTIIYDWSSSGSYGIYVGDTDSTAYCYNMTIHNCNVGYGNDGAATHILKNCIANDCTDDFSGIMDSTSTHNVTDTTGVEGAFGATHATGTTTGTTANKLIDSGGGLSAAQVGSIVENDTDTTYTYVTAIDSDTQLSINDDIFVSGEDYIIYTNMYGSVTFANEGGDDFHLAHNDTVAKNKGTDLSSDANLPIWDDIDREERG